VLDHIQMWQEFN